MPWQIYAYVETIGLCTVFSLQIGTLSTEVIERSSADFIKHRVHWAILANIYIEPHYPPGLLMFQHVTNTCAPASLVSIIPAQDSSHPPMSKAWPGDTAVTEPPCLTQATKPKAKMSEMSVKRSDSALFHTKNMLICLLEPHYCTSLAVRTPCANRQATPPHLLGALGCSHWSPWELCYLATRFRNLTPGCRAGGSVPGDESLSQPWGKAPPTLLCPGSSPSGWLWKFSFFPSLMSFVIIQVWRKQKVVAGER